MKTSLYSRVLALPFLALLLSLVASLPAEACAACYNANASDRMGRAATIGIAVMVVIMFAMLAAVGGFIYHLAYRAKHPLPDYSELLSEDEGGDETISPAPQP